MLSPPGIYLLPAKVLLPNYLVLSLLSLAIKWKNSAALKVVAAGICGSREVSAIIGFGWANFGEVFPWFGPYPFPNRTISDIEGSF